jgi:uncharacterized protein with HEPN domain
MPRDYRVYLDDILESIKAIEEFAGGLSFAEFSNDRRTFDAVVRNLEIIGEAIKKTPESIRSKNPGVPWKKIGSLRDILAHEYFRIDKEIIWDVLKNKLPELKREASRILETG